MRVKSILIICLSFSRKFSKCPQDQVGRQLRDGTHCGLESALHGFTASPRTKAHRKTKPPPNRTLSLQVRGRLRLCLLFWNKILHPNIRLSQSPPCFPSLVLLPGHVRCRCRKVTLSGVRAKRWSTGSPAPIQYPLIVTLSPAVFLLPEGFHPNSSTWHLRSIRIWPQPLLPHKAKILDQLVG